MALQHLSVGRTMLLTTARSLGVKSAARARIFLTLRCAPNRRRSNCRQLHQSKHARQTSTEASSDEEGGLGHHLYFRMLP